MFHLGLCARKNEIKERVLLWSRCNMAQAVLVDLVPDDLHVGGHGILWQKSNFKLNQVAPINQKKKRGAKAKSNVNIPVSSRTVDFFAIGGGSPAHTAFSL